VHLDNRRVLITGASGFVGANLVRKFTNVGAHTIGIIRPDSDLWRLSPIDDLKLLRLDLRDHPATITTIRDAAPEVIVHAAAASGHPRTASQRSEAVDSTIIATANLLEAAIAAGVPRFIHIGSSLEYGARDAPLSEQTPLEPTSFRGAAKAAATLLVDAYARSGLAISTLRLFSVWGYWEAPTRFFPRAIAAAIFGRLLSITTANHKRDWIFIDDVAEACVKTVRATESTGQTFNIGSGTQHGNHEVIAVIQKVLGTQVAIADDEFPPQPTDVPHWVADNRKAREVLDWQPHVQLEDGILRFARWMKQHQHFYAP